jgi:hypothetical protein
MNYIKLCMIKDGRFKMKAGCHPTKQKPACTEKYIRTKSVQLSPHTKPGNFQIQVDSIGF